MALLPPLRHHLETPRSATSSAAAFLLRPAVALALLGTATLMTAQFAIVPNIAAYWQFNLAYPRDRLGLLFVLGGAASFGCMRLAGRLGDRIGAAVTTAGGTAFYAAVVLAAFVFPGSAKADPPALCVKRESYGEVSP